MNIFAASHYSDNLEHDTNLPVLGEITVISIILSIIGSKAQSGRLVEFSSIEGSLPTDGVNSTQVAEILLFVSEDAASSSFKAWQRTYSGASKVVAICPITE